MRLLISAFLILSACVSNGYAAVKMPSIFSDHMVLQRDKPVPIWGQANPGEEVTVEFANQKKTTLANAAGRWNLTLDPMPANAEPQLLNIGSVSIQDVLVGDVWLASGQSNMEWEMQMKPDSKADIPNATHPNLRIIEIPKTVALTPQDDVPAVWSPCTPESVASFSAVGYYFGLKLHSELNVPVGIIQSAWGGTRIEPWTSEAGFGEVPELKEFAADVQAKLPGSAAYRRKQEEHLAAVETWSKTARSALESKQALPALPAQPATFTAGAGTPTALYNAMIHPLVPFAVRGAIWYQGESNHNEGFVYTDKKKALLASWRTAFQQPELPFYFVQIAPFQYGEEDPEILPQFWQAQRECLRIPHTGMAVISDIGEVPDIHPAHKKEVARRLSLWALAKTYGRSGVDPSGPLYASHAIEGNAIRVKFDNASTGLATRDGKPLTHFEIAGRDGLFQEGAATIEGDSVIVTSSKVPQPRRVRFAWSKTAIPNLMDKDGLPATAFHTHWPVDPDLGPNLARDCKWISSDKNVWAWDMGLTDGSWATRAPHCFATSNADAFPKHVTIDMKQSQTLNLIRLGTPEIGSTKTIAISLSNDGQNFKEVGRHVFPLGKSEQTSVEFPDVEARHIRLTYLDHHLQEAGGFSNTFAFTTEVEAYRAK